MKRKIFSILFALVLVLVLAGTPVMAQLTWVLHGTAHGGPWTTFLGPCFDVTKAYGGGTAYLRVEPFTHTDGGYSYDGSLQTVNFYVDADNSDTESMGDFMLEYHHSQGKAAYHHHDGTSWVWGSTVSTGSLVLPPGMAVTWDDGSFPAYVELSIPGTMVPTGVIGIMIYAVGHGACTNYSANPGPGYGSWDLATWADILYFVPMSEFKIDKASIDFGNPGDGRVSVKGTLALDPSGDGVNITDDVTVTVDSISDTITMVAKDGKWEYKRPNGVGAIKKMKIDWNKGKFDISMEQADLSGLTDPEQVTISVQVGDDLGEDTIQMTEKKRWDYKAK